MSLKDERFRFVCRNDKFLWVHKAEMRDGDIDCTDMPEDEFVELVKEKITGYSATHDSGKE